MRGEEEEEEEEGEREKDEGSQEDMADSSSIRSMYVRTRGRLYDGPRHANLAD